LPTRLLSTPSEKKLLLNGYPKYLHGLALLTQRFHFVHLEFALWLQVAEVAVLEERAAARHISGERPEDDDVNFRRRLQNFGEWTLPVLHKLADFCEVFTLNGSNPLEVVQDTAAEFWARPVGCPGSRRSNSARGSRERRDPDEADFEVGVLLMSGEERLRPLLPARATIASLHKMLIDDGETEFDLKFFFQGKEIMSNQMLLKLDGFGIDSTIHMVRQEKPPPPPSNSYDYPCCFTGDSLACALRTDGEDVHLPFSAVRVGDFVRTRPGQGSDCFRRVQRVWAHHWAKQVTTFEVAPGCRLTPGHPLMCNLQWVRPEDLCAGEETFEEFVYQLEVEGHVDTALVGGIPCALLGCYCGPDFGWNVFTRKTVQCDRQPCAKCAKACLPGLDFDPARLHKRMLPPACFEPY